MDEASRCDMIALMNEGKILGIDTPENMVKRFDSPLYGVKAKNMFALLEVARKQPGVLDCYPFGEMHHLVADASFNAEEMKKALANVEGFCIEPVVPTIEDMFIKLMKQ